ncbi:MAG: selenocysteine-specific translation elongation factor [Gammaproteobacteria bacterium]|nr:MAG: selenocysteine-specific translation elongation factor [Gammaproteobacteria bacterium]
MIIGTAGHIDHGKTTLVRALTGVDTDRLKEEKARGISIELGYAYTPLANGALLGFIDVPGHERLVHTMVAGACGIDFALLVVAADDGVMPQTREHVAILELLGVSQGAVALTKIDRVDRQRLDEVNAQVKALLGFTALNAAPLFALDATAADHPGTTALRHHLHQMAGHARARADQGLFRLAVDRVFTLAGHGTVVTGTVFSGQVRTGDTVAVMPAGLSARVRSIHAQSRAADAGRAGERCALNLAGVEKSAISRGDWLADPRALAPSTRIDVRMRLLADSGAHLEPWSPLHVHLGTTHRLAHAVPLESAGPSAGEAGRVQLVFDTPICALPGDRFIVRDAQGRHTLGGGRVLDPCAPARRRRSVERLGSLAALERMLAGEGIAPLLQQARFGVRISDLVRLTGCPPERLPLPCAAITMAAGGEQFVLLPEQWQALREGAMSALRRFHADVPDEPGPDVGRLRRITLPDMPATLWRALVDELARERLVHFSGAWLHLPEHSVTLSASDQTLARKLQPLIAAGRFDPPWVRELAARVHEPEERVREVLRKQVTQGGVYQVVRDLFYDRERIAELAEIVGAAAREHGVVNAARFRDTLGLGRKRAIQILEFFDRVGYTRRVRDAHVLRPDSAWRSMSGSASGSQGAAAPAPSRANSATSPR